MNGAANNSEKPEGPHHGPIPRVTTKRELLEAVRARRPVLYSFGEAKSKEWAEEIMASIQGARFPVSIEHDERPRTAPEPWVTNLGYVLDLWTSKWCRRWLSVDEAVATGGRFVISGANLWFQEHRPETRKRGEFAHYKARYTTTAAFPVIAALDDLVPENSIRQVTGCWISNRGVVTPIHWDSVCGHNFHFICAGEKQVYLYLYEESEHLYCVGGPPTKTGFVCAVDPGRPDLARYPDYAKARGFFATVKAGDVLFIPAHTWHHFTHTGDINMSMTRWFHEPPDLHPRVPSLPARIHLNFLRFFVGGPLLDLLCWLRQCQICSRRSKAMAKRS